MQLLLNYNYDKIKRSVILFENLMLRCFVLLLMYISLFTYMIILLVLIDDQLHEIQRKTFCFECLGIYVVGPSTLSDNYI